MARSRSRVRGAPGGGLAGGFMVAYRPIGAAIYDLDGLLLDTESINETVNRLIAERHGCPYDPAVKRRVAGRDAVASAEILVAALRLPLTAAEFLRQRRAAIAAMNPYAAPMAGAVELTRHLHGHGIPQAIATSSTRYPFDWKSAPHGDWFGVFREVVLRDDPAVTAGKPAPDLFLIAAERLGVAPQDCLVFEDSVAGVEAAIAAGMVAIAVPSPDADFGDYGDAALTLNSLTAFDPAPWGLPPWPRSLNF